MASMHCVLPGRLGWMSGSVMPANTLDIFYFNITTQPDSVDQWRSDASRTKALIYEPFHLDFGPLNLGHVFRYCKLVDEMLSKFGQGRRLLVQWCPPCPKEKTNTVLLACLYAMIVGKQSAAEAFKSFRSLRSSLLPFRDATNRPLDEFELTVEDCLAGMEHAMRLGWFNLSSFNVEAYDFLDHLDPCGINWILPNKFVAFAGPCDDYGSDGGFHPDLYIPYFKELQVQLVIRLNSKQYDERHFKKHGIAHEDLFFNDGTCPSPEIIERFLESCEKTTGAVAVHCKAGLGRTCTLIGLYAMKHYGFSARGFIAWSRLCRPGSVLGQQQEFLIRMEPIMKQAGSTPGGGGLPDDSVHNADVALESCAGGKMSRRSSIDSVSTKESIEDVGQGERLCNARRNARRSKTSSSSSSEDSRKSTDVPEKATRPSGIPRKASKVLADCMMRQMQQCPMLLGRQQNKKEAAEKKNDKLKDGAANENNTSTARSYLTGPFP